MHTVMQEILVFRKVSYWKGRQLSGFIIIHMQLGSFNVLKVANSNGVFECSRRATAKTFQELHLLQGVVTPI